MKLNGVLLVLAILFASCSPQLSAVWQKSNYSPRTMDKLAVIAISKNLTVRQSLESDLVKELKKDYPNKDIVTGLTLFPPNESGSWTEENIENELKSRNVDGVVTVCIIDSYNTQETVPGDVYGYPIAYGVGPRIYSTYNYIGAPDYYQTVQNYVLQTSLYDLSLGSGKKDNLYWLGESKVQDPSSVADGAARYAKNVVDNIQEKALIR